MRKRFISIFKPLGPGSKTEEDSTNVDSPTPPGEKKLGIIQSFKDKRQSTKEYTNEQKVETKKENPKTPTEQKKDELKEDEKNQEIKQEVKQDQSTPEIKIDETPKELTPTVEVPQPIVKRTPTKKKKKNDDFDWLDFLENEKKEDVLKKEPLKPEEAKKIIHDFFKTRVTNKKFKKFFTKDPGLRDSRIRKQLLREILDTEMDYVKSLKLIIDGFLNPIRKSKILKDQQISSIFLSVELIAKIQDDFLKNIKNELEMPFPYQPKLGRVFSNWAPQLEKNYSEFISGFDEADKTLQKLLDTNSNFKKLIEKLQQNPECQSLPLQGILIKPVQRLPRYGLLLRDLINRTPSDHVDANGIKEALKSIEKVTSIANEQKREMENTKLLLEVERKLPQNSKLIIMMKDQKRKLKYQSLFKVFIKQFKFDKVQVEIPQELYELYVFTDMVLLLKKRNDPEEKVVYYIIHYLFTTIFFDEKSNNLYLKSKFKSKDYEFYITPENPSVDLLFNWNGYFVKEINNFLTTKNLKMEEIKQVLATKQETDSQIKQLIVKKEEKDLKKKEINQEYIPLKSQLREDEINLELMYEKIKILEKRVATNKEKTKIFENEISVIEKETKCLGLEYKEIKKKDDEIENKLFKLMDDKKSYKNVFGGYPNINESGFDFRFFNLEWEIAKNPLFLTDPPKEDPQTAYFWHDIHIDNVLLN